MFNFVILYNFCPIVIQIFIGIFVIVEFIVYMKVYNSYVNIFVSKIWVIIFLYLSLNHTNFSLHVSNKKFYLCFYANATSWNMGIYIYILCSYWNSLLTYMVKINTLHLKENIFFRCFIFLMFVSHYQINFNIPFFISITLRMI